MNKRNILIAGACFGFLAVALGAFGAHALKPLLTQLGTLETYSTAVHYQFIMTLALLWLGTPILSEKDSSVVGFLFLVGTLIFSGSLYIYSTTLNKTIVMFAPVGGLLLLAGWAWLIFSVVRKN